MQASVGLKLNAIYNYDDALACLFSAASGHCSIFTNKERDSESGNDYFGARYYASTMGRFLSPDWSAKVEPIPYSKLDDPQSLNLYAYVLNNPLTKSDPDGHESPWISDRAGVEKFDDSVKSSIQAAKDFVHDHPLLTNLIVTSTIAILSEGRAKGPAPAEAPAAEPAGESTKPLVGNNPREAGTRTNTDLPGGHQAAEKTFGEQTAGQKTRLDPKTGHTVSEDGSRLRKNSDGTARVDLPNRGSKPNGETIHFNQPDPKPNHQ
jgi:RHS repeat-associated protein